MHQNVLDSKNNGSKVKNLLETHGELQVKELKKIIPLILYICSEKVKITGPYSHDIYNQRLKEKQFLEFPEVKDPVIWEVGKER